MLKISQYDDGQELAVSIVKWGEELGFNQIRFASIELGEAESNLITWLKQGWHGEMAYMKRHGFKRTRPKQLIPNTISIICARLDYKPPTRVTAEHTLSNPELAYISRYALDSDYHRIIRRKLQKLAQQISDRAGAFNYRVFCDSAPVMEKPLAQMAGLGWQGKHTVLINPQHGSWFFLGEIYTDLPLPPSSSISKSYCGSCTKCIDVCPTKAIVADYQLDARKCISYLTIEYRGSIPLEYRPLIGNRIFGCDDCQLVCPWNKYAKISKQSCFHPRTVLEYPQLLELFSWSADEFIHNLEGSPIRRIGHQIWLRNIAVALGNADYRPGIVDALHSKLDQCSKLASEHILWALKQQERKSQSQKN